MIFFPTPFLVYTVNELFPFNVLQSGCAVDGSGVCRCVHACDTVVV